MGKYKSSQKAAAFHEAAAAAAAAAAVVGGGAALKSGANYIIQAQSLDESFGGGGTTGSCCNKECFLRYLRKIITFLISRVGLMIIVVGYVLAGGLIIEALEADYERKALEMSNRVLEHMLQRIYRQIENNSTRVKDYSFYMFLRSEIRYKMMKY